MQHKLFQLFFIGILCGVLFSAENTYAGPIIRSGESISIDSTQTLRGDFYGFASNVTISGLTENDSYILGGSVTVNAPVQEDLTIVAGVVQVHGDVGDDLRVVGGEVTLAKSVKGDVVVVGGSLNILSTVSVGGDVIFMGEDLVVEGEVVGSVYGRAERARINSKIGSDVDLIAKVSLGDKSDIQGSVTYQSVEDIVRAQNAVVVGEIRKEDFVVNQNSEIARFMILQVLTLLFAALTVHAIFRRHVQSVLGCTTQSFGRSGLIGLFVFLAMPLIGLVLLLSVIGLILGIFILIAYILALIFAGILLVSLLGYYVQKAFMKKTAVTYTTLLFGIVTIIVFGPVPYIGGLLLLASLLVSLGGISLFFYRLVR